MRRAISGLAVVAMLLAACTPGAGTRTGPKVQPPWGTEARTKPMRSDMINLTHLNFLVEPMSVPDKPPMAMTHIYSEAPKYEWVDASGEGLACVDDVARAAVVYLDYYRQTKDKAALEQAKLLLNFVLYMQAEDGEYFNFVTDKQGTINRAGQTSFKSWSWWAARGQWALAEGYALFKDLDKTYAATLKEGYLKGEQALGPALARYGQWDQLHGVKTPAWLLGGGSDLSSLALYGLAVYYEADPNDQTRGLMEKLGEGVAAYQLGTFAQYPFGAQPSNISSTALWHAWGSHQVMALARAGRVLKRSDWVDAARFTADSFYSYLLTADLINEMAVAIKPQGQIAYGAGMLVHGLLELYQATGNDQYLKYAGLAGSWFFGNNIAGTAMYDPETGRGYDGINGANAYMVNRNAGAESTIEALMALERLVREPVAARYLTMKEASRSPAVYVEAEDGKPAAGQPQYGRRDWTGEGSFSNGRYYGLAPGDAVELKLSVPQAGEYHLYLAHERQAAPKPKGSTEIPAVKAPGAVIPDGMLDAAEWQGALVLAVDKPEQLLRGGAAWPGPEKDSFRFRVMWDEQNLYIGAEVKDPEHKQLDIGPGVWRGDTLWIYMDTMGDKSRVDVKLTLAQTEQGPQVWDWKGGAYLPGAKLAWKQVDGGYVYEAALPIASLGTLRVEPDRVVGMEVGRGATGGGFMDWAGLDPDAAQNLAPLRFYATPPQRTGDSGAAAQGPADVAVTVQVGDHAPFVLPEAVSPDRDYLWLDRLTGTPLFLEPGTYTVRVTGNGHDPQRSSVVDGLWLVPAKQTKVLQAPDGRRLELVRDWDAALTQWKE